MGNYLIKMIKYLLFILAMINTTNAKGCVNGTHVSVWINDDATCLKENLYLPWTNPLRLLHTGKNLEIMNDCYAQPKEGYSMRIDCNSTHYVRENYQTQDCSGPILHSMPLPYGQCLRANGLSWNTWMTVDSPLNRKN